MKCSKTPAQPAGPFFKQKKLSDLNDLTNNGMAAGKRIKIEGKILDNNCRPYPNCLIDIWQANTYGKYNHKNDYSDNELDKNFNGYKKIVANSEGFYSFTTILPGSYKISNNILRPPHIHLLIKTKSNKSLTTQLYFKGHPLNKNDFILNNINNKSLLEVSLVKSENNIRKAIFNIII